MLKRFQKALRTNQTDAESRLWYHLRSRRFQGWKFRRQHILQGYIVDFVCLEKKLVIELDGGQHADQEAYDNHRTQILEKNGFKVMRFWNNDVLSNLEGILEMILNAPHPSLRDDLSPCGRGKKSLISSQIFMRWPWLLRLLLLTPRDSNAMTLLSSI